MSEGYVEGDRGGAGVGRKRDDVPGPLAVVADRLYQIPTDRSGVYFLTQGDRIVYVGKTESSVRGRVKGHRGDGKEFEACFFLPVDRSIVAHVEGYAIARLTPELNRRTEPYVERLIPADVVAFVDHIAESQHQAVEEPEPNEDDDQPIGFDDGESIDDPHGVVGQYGPVLILDGEYQGKLGFYDGEDVDEYDELVALVYIPEYSGRLFVFDFCDLATVSQEVWDQRHADATLASLMFGKNYAMLADDSAAERNWALTIDNWLGGPTAGKPLPADDANDGGAV